MAEYDTTIIVDKSLNRCSKSGMPYEPQSFKLGKPTPGSENDYTGPHFILGDSEGAGCSFFLGGRGPAITDSSTLVATAQGSLEPPLPPSHAFSNDFELQCQATSFVVRALESYATQESIGTCESREFHTSMETDEPAEEFEMELDYALLRAVKEGDS